VSEEEAALRKLPAGELKRLCKERGVPVTGSKAVLVARLLEPPLGEALTRRKAQGLYVPRADSANAAILVALYLHEQSVLTRQEQQQQRAQVGGGGGAALDQASSSAPMRAGCLLSKAELLLAAEATGISTAPMQGTAADDDAEAATANAGGGVFHYDGWAGVKKYLLQPSSASSSSSNTDGGGCGPLAATSFPLMVRKGRDRFALSTLPTGGSGRDVACALHDLACRVQRRCKCGGGGALAETATAATAATKESGGGGGSFPVVDDGSEQHSQRRAAVAASAPAGAVSSVVGLRDLSASSFLNPAVGGGAGSAAAGSAVSTQPPRSQPQQHVDVTARGGEGAGNNFAGGRPEGGDGRGVAATAVPAVPKAPRAAVRCGRCGATGHNARNAACPLFGNSQPAAAVETTEENEMRRETPPVERYSGIYSPVSSPEQIGSSNRQARSGDSPEIIILD